MNWDAIGAIGEIVGAIAVVVSLMYLAAQIRTSSRLAKAQMFQSLAAEQSRVADGITGDQRNLETWLKMHSGEKLNNEEYARANFILSRIFQAMLSIQIGYENGQISKEFLMDAKAQTDGLFTGKVKRPARKYLERYHPNLKTSQIFSTIMGSEETDE